MTTTQFSLANGDRADPVADLADVRNAQPNELVFHFHAVFDHVID